MNHWQPGVGHSLGFVGVSSISAVHMAFASSRTLLIGQCRPDLLPPARQEKHAPFSPSTLKPKLFERIAYSV